MNMKKICIPLIVFSLFYGCSSIPQGTAVATSPVNMGNGKQVKFDVMGKSEGSAGHFTLFGFIPFGRTDIDKAIAEAVAAKSGDNLIDVDYTINTSFWFIGNYTSMTVKGKVIKYVDKVSMNEATASGQLQQNSTAKSEVPKAHLLTAGLFSKGIPVTYALEMKQSKLLSTFLSIGYCAFTDEKTSTYTYYDYFSRTTFTYGNKVKEKHQFLPIIFGGIINSEGLFTLPSQYPVYGYLSAGLGLAPDFGVLDQRTEALINLGYAVGIGVEYRVLPQLGLGLQYSSFNVIYGDREFGMSNGDHPSFSSFGLLLRYTP